MEQFPLELIQQILAQLDLKTVGNAALSCRKLFEVFKSAEGFITSEILLREIDCDVLPEAILVSKSRVLNHPEVSKYDREEFAHEHFKRRKSVTRELELAEALHLAQFHEKIRYFAERAARESLSKQPRLTTGGLPAEPTHEELCRFERALYRFEMCCNMIMGLRRQIFFLGHEPCPKVLSYFAPWENEQLACIHEHLARVIARPFNYMVDHDVTWGYLGVDYIFGPKMPQAQAIMLEGIDRIYHLSQASTYEEYHVLLSRGEGRSHEPLRRTGFGIYEKSMEACLLYLSRNLSTEGRIETSRPFYQDRDSGPAMIWSWIYRDQPYTELAAAVGMIGHRQWAFPFWDYSRLAAAGLLGDPEIPGPMSSDDPELGKYRIWEHRIPLRRSQGKRAKIWKKNGYGWYDRDDLSRIQWGRRETYPEAPSSSE